MSDRATSLRRGAAERAVAWLATGPLGHLYATLADLAGFALAGALERRRQRARRPRSRSALH